MLPPRTSWRADLSRNASSSSSTPRPRRPKYIAWNSTLPDVNGSEGCSRGCRPFPPTEHHAWHLHPRVREYKVRRGPLPERSQVACGIRQEHSNIQRYYLRAFDTRGATDSSSAEQHVSAVRARAPLFRAFLSRAMNSTALRFAVAASGWI